MRTHVFTYKVRAHDDNIDIFIGYSSRLHCHDIIHVMKSQAICACPLVGFPFGSFIDMAYVVAAARMTSTLVV